MRIEVNLSEEEVLCLNHDLLDIDQWVQEAVKGKVNNCKKRMVNEWMPKLLQDPDVESIPADESKLLSMIGSHKDYKSRKDRESV